MTVQDKSAKLVRFTVDDSVVRLDINMLVEFVQNTNQVITTKAT